MTTQPDDLIRRIDEDDVMSACIEHWRTWLSVEAGEIVRDITESDRAAMRAALAALIKRGWVPSGRKRIEHEALSQANAALGVLLGSAPISLIQLEQCDAAYNLIRAALHPHEAEEKKT